MKTWRLKIVGNNGQKLSVRQAVARYVFSLFSLGLCFVGFVWALFDKEHQFLHDRLAGTRIIKQ